MKRVIQYNFKPNSAQSSILKELTRATYKLWNIANYQRKQYDKNSGLPYPNWFYQKKILKDTYWYKQLPSQSAQEVLNTLNQSWKSFFVLLKKFNNHKIENKPNPPKFKHSAFNIRFLNNSFRIKDNKLLLTLSKQFKLYLKEKYNINEKYLIIKINKAYINKLLSGNLKMIEIIPLNNNYKVNMIVEFLDNVIELKEVNNEQIYMSIDFGVNNLMTCYISNDKTFIISGRQFLSINRYFDKTISYYQSISDKQQSAKGIKYPKKSKRVKKLYEKGNKQIYHLIHAATKKIIDIAKSNNVDTIVIGDITNIRKNNNIGKQNNQKFHKLPFKILENQIKYKANENNIKVEKQEESYTSMCSPLSPMVDKQYAIKSNRKYRGLYKENNQIYNADCVGAYNILRKYFHCHENHNMYLCRIDNNIYSAVVGLDSPTMYQWGSDKWVCRNMNPLTVENRKLAYL